MKKYWNYYIQVLKQYANFKGRAARTEYWSFFVINLLMGFVMGGLDMVVHTSQFFDGGGLLATIYSFGVLIPNLAVAARRLHDTNRSGWWLLIGCIPVLGILVLLYFFFKPSQSGKNQFGS